MWTRAPSHFLTALYVFQKKKQLKKKNVLMPRSVLLQISIVSLLRREAKSPVRSRGLAAQFFKKSYLNFLLFTFSYKKSSFRIDVMLKLVDPMSK